MPCNLADSIRLQCAALASVSAGVAVNSSYYDVLIDLWTDEKERNDLVLSAYIRETSNSFEITIDMVYVP
jgi:hypothetical protein